MILYYLEGIKKLSVPSYSHLLRKKQIAINLDFAIDRFYQEDVPKSRSESQVHCDKDGDETERMLLFEGFD